MKKALRAYLEGGGGAQWLLKPLSCLLEITNIFFFCSKHVGPVQWQLAKHLKIWSNQKSFSIFVFMRICDQSWQKARILYDPDIVCCWKKLKPMFIKFVKNFRFSVLHIFQVFLPLTLFLCNEYKSLRIFFFFLFHISTFHTLNENAQKSKTSFCQYLLFTVLFLLQWQKMYKTEAPYFTIPVYWRWKAKKAKKTWKMCKNGKSKNL